jgi:hypothetical protein
MFKTVPAAIAVVAVLAAVAVASTLRVGAADPEAAAAVSPALALTGVPSKARLKLSCTFAHSPSDCGFRLQAKEPSRASLADKGRDGGRGLRLRTEPGDRGIAGSGDMERADVRLDEAETGCFEGREQVWEHSMLLPDDFAMPTWHMYVLFDFHHSGPRGQANFHVLHKDGVLRFWGFGGERVGDGFYQATIGPAKKNVWYDFVYHVKWTSRRDGFFRAWVNGEQKLDHRGPTLYAGQGCYLKLANYHTPVCDPYPGCRGAPSAVIHDRVIRHDVGR